tara:strand:- start:56202 stop:58937 length:2736 start_codon:yes stop_codon:yes gene_type:complete
MKKHLLYVILFFCSIQQFYSQESQEDGVVAFNLSVRNSLKFNQYTINPTFSFVRQQNKYISFSNKREWVQFDDAPQTYLFSYSGRFSENAGIGVGLFQQNYGVLTTFGGVLNYAYNAVMNNDNNLTFGVNLGVYKSGLNEGNVVTNFPDASLDNIPSNTIITINPGINYGTDFIDFGVSLNNIVSYNFKTSKIIEDNPEQSVQGHIMYTGYMNSRGFFDESKFSTLLRSEFKKDNTVVSGLAMITVPKGIWAQAGYNTLYGVSAGIGLNITSQIAIEYNYEKGMGNLSNFGNSHDITLAFKFNNRYRYDYSGDDEEAAFIIPKKKTTRTLASRKTTTTTTQVDRKAVAENKAKAREDALANIKAKAEARAQLVAQAKAEREAKIEEIAPAKLEAVAQAKADEETKTEAPQTQANPTEVARIKAESEAKAKLAEVENQTKLEAEAAAKAKMGQEATARLVAAKAKAEAEAKRVEAARIKAEEEKARLVEAQNKAKLEAVAKAKEEARVKLAEAAKIKAEVEAKAKLAEAEKQARLEAEAAAKTKLEQEENARLAVAKEKEEAEAKLAEAARIKAEEDAKAKLAELENQVQLEAEAAAKADKEAQTKLAEAEQAKTETVIPEPTDATTIAMSTLAKSTQDSKIAQQELLAKLSESVAIKEQDLKDLKEENDLSEQGIFQAPKAFKSVSAENAALESLKSQIDAAIKSQDIKISELEKLYSERLNEVPNKNDAVNVSYLKTIQAIKQEQTETVQSKADLIAALEDIKVATEVERKRRIKRAAYDNEQDRYLKDRAALEQIKKFTPESTVPLTSDDFDFGEEQSSNIQIIKDIKHVESGYYLVLAVHSDVAKRDEFLAKAVSLGQTNINFFYDVNTSKYFIYYDAFDDIESARQALQSKGNTPYNGKMSMVKIEN